MYSYRVEQAIRAAAILHKNQLRKGSAPLPYITHLVAVAMIAGDYTDNEDVIVGALLHDTLEDTDYTSTELQEDFGGQLLLCHFTHFHYYFSFLLSVDFITTFHFYSFSFVISLPDSS